MTLTLSMVGPLIASGLLIALARISPELAQKISAWLGSPGAAERDLDLTQMEYWRYQEAERFIRENPLAPTEGMSFGRITEDQFGPAKSGAGELGWHGGLGTYVAKSVPRVDVDLAAIERELPLPGGIGAGSSLRGPYCKWLVWQRDALRVAWRTLGANEVEARSGVEGLGKRIAEEISRMGCEGPGSPVAAGLPGDPARRVFGCGCC